MMARIKERFDRWIFERDLRAARRKFERIRRSSAYNKAPVMERRNYIKDILRGAFKSIRIKER